MPFKANYTNLEELLKAVGSRRGTIRAWLLATIEEKEGAKPGLKKLLPAWLIRAAAEVSNTGEYPPVIQDLTCEEFVPSGKNPRDRIEEIRRIAEAMGLQFVYGPKGNVVRV